MFLLFLLILYYKLETVHVIQAIIEIDIIHNNNRFGHRIFKPHYEPYYVNNLSANPYSDDSDDYVYADGRDYSDYYFEDDDNYQDDFEQDSFGYIDDDDY